MPGLDAVRRAAEAGGAETESAACGFATAFDHYAVQAFDVNAVDYVLKPFDKARINRAIQKVKREIEAQTSPTERLGRLVPAAAAEGGSAQPVEGAVVRNGGCIWWIRADLPLKGFRASFRSWRRMRRRKDVRIPHAERNCCGGAGFGNVLELAARSYLVNIRHIKEVVPWSSRRSCLKMDDKRAVGDTG